MNWWYLIPALLILCAVKRRWVAILWAAAFIVGGVLMADPSDCPSTVAAGIAWCK